MCPELLYSKYLYADENHKVKAIKRYFQLVLVKFHPDWVAIYHPELLI